MRNALLPLGICRVETGRFDVIERRLIEKVIEEQKMGASGMLDPNGEDNAFSGATIGIDYRF